MGSLQAVLIRDAKPGDEAHVADVHVRAWKAAYPGLIPQQYLDSLTPADRIPGYSFGAGGGSSPATILALDGRHLLGFATFGPCRDEDVPAAGELHALYVDPDRWRTGAGRTLLSETRARLHSGGHREAVLWVLHGNDPAVRFYEADGWRGDGAARWEEPWGVLSRVYRYRRELP